MTRLTDITSRRACGNRRRSRRRWAVTDAPADFIDSMLRAIVGIEIEVTSLVGKWKVSQNRPAADRDGVVRGLADVSGSDAAAMARSSARRAAWRDAVVVIRSPRARSHMRTTMGTLKRRCAAGALASPRARARLGSGSGSSACRPSAAPFEDTMAQRVLACTGCHGAQGRAAPDGYYPRIAGKPAGYLYNQLLNFRDGRRHYALMNGLLAPLNDAYLREIAEHFASPRDSLSAAGAAGEPRATRNARSPHGWSPKATRRAACRLHRLPRPRDDRHARPSCPACSACRATTSTPSSAPGAKASAAPRRPTA